MSELIRTIALAAVLVVMVPQATGDEPQSGELTYIEDVDHTIADETAQAVIEQLLRDVQAKRNIIRRDLRNIPDRVDAEVRQIQAKLDGFWQSDEVRRLFDEHHDRVASSIEHVSLPADLGRLQLVWEQAKSTVGQKAELERIIDEFIRRADREVQSDREELLERLIKRFGDLSAQEYTAAKDRLRAPFIEVISRELPAWEQAALMPPALPTPVGEAPPNGQGGLPGQLALSGALLIIVNRILRRITRQLVGKMLGRVLSKLIPVVGWLLIALDVWDATQAKAKMETEMRSAFVSEYRAEFQPITIWTGSGEAGEPSMRTEVLDSFRTDLKAWAQLCSEEAARVLTAAEVLHLSPNAADFIRAEAQRGQSTQYIIENFHMAWNVFGEVVRVYPIEELLNLASAAPTHDIVRQLRRRLGDRLILDYRTHGADYLRAAERIGVDLFLELRIDEQLDWSAVYEALYDYPKDMEPDAKRGLAVLVGLGLADPRLTPSALEQVHRERQIVTALARDVDRGRILELIQDRRRARSVAQVVQSDEDLGIALAGEWSVSRWNRYAQGGVVEDLLGMWAYRRGERKQSVEDFARETADDDVLLTIWTDVGLEGLRIWDRFVTKQAGSHQRDQARRAIDLYRKGFEGSALTPGTIGFAGHCANIPLVGALTFNNLHGLGWIAYAILILALGLIGVIVLLIGWRIVRMAVPIRLGKGRR